MTDLKSVSAPAIGEAGLKRLVAFARPSRLKPDCTLFDAGYEQCKADFLFKINAEVAVPTIIQHTPAHTAGVAELPAVKKPYHYRGWLTW